MCLWVSATWYHEKKAPDALRARSIHLPQAIPNCSQFFPVFISIKQRIHIHPLPLSTYITLLLAFCLPLKPQLRTLQQLYSPWPPGINTVPSQTLRLMPQHFWIHVIQMWLSSFSVISTNFFNVCPLLCFLTFLILSLQAISLLWHWQNTAPPKRSENLAASNS